MADFQETHRISNLGKDKTLIFKRNANVIEKQIQICNHPSKNFKLQEAQPVVQNGENGGEIRCHTFCKVPS